MRRIGRQFVLYVAGQIVAYGVDLGVFVALVHGAAVYELYANVASKVCAFCFAYLFHGAISFRGEKAQGHGKSLANYLLVLAINAGLSTLLLSILLAHVPMPATLLKIFSDVVLVVLTFTLVRKLVYPMRQPVATDGASAPTPAVDPSLSGVDAAESRSSGR